MKNRVFVTSALTGIVDGLILRPEGFRTLKLRPGIAAKDATMALTLMTPEPEAGEDTVLILTGAFGCVPNQLVVSNDGTYSKAISVAGYAAVIPVNFPTTGAKDLYLKDGFHADVAVSVNVVATTPVTGTFAVSYLKYDTAVVGLVSQPAVVGGTGMLQVASVWSDTTAAPLTFKRYRDTFIVIDVVGLAAGANVIRLRNAAGADLYTFTVTATETQSDVVAAWYTQVSGAVSVWLETDDACDAPLLIFPTGGSAYVGESGAASDYFESLTEVDSMFVMTARLKNGQVMPYTAYRVATADGSLHFESAADADGMIRIPKALLPDVFQINFDYMGLKYLNRIFRKAAL